ncbi:MAG TPA: undecaprenyl-diphosphate phosphatase, partial [Vicinamibacterales bacterium]
MTLLLAALLGIVQGVTEFLPISSTAHLLLIAEAVGFDDPGGVFTVMIQLGSIFAVVWVYRVRLFGLAVELGTSAEARHFAAAIVVATIPALAAGALFGDFIQSVLYKSPRVFAGAFIAGGIIMLLVERLRPAPVVSEAEQTSLPRALGIGLCQMLALIPGVSRSGAT